jgi:hypothetical protein
MSTYRWTIDASTSGSVTAETADEALALFGARDGVTARYDNATATRGEIWVQHTGYASYDVVDDATGENITKMERHRVAA